MSWTYHGIDDDGQFYSLDLDGQKHYAHDRDAWLARVNGRKVKYTLAKFDGDIVPESVGDDPSLHPQCIEVLEAYSDRPGVTVTYRRPD